MRPGPEDWMAEAEADIAAARGMAETGQFKWAVSVARHSVEEALKGAYEVTRRLEPPHVHGLRHLARETFGEVPPRIADALRLLDPLYTVSRYPNAVSSRPSEEYDEDDVREFVAAAAEVIAWTSDRLNETS